MTALELARYTTASLNAGDATMLAVQWLGLRYQEVAIRRRLRPFRVARELVVSPVMTAGTVTCVQGSPQITGDATARAAWALDAAAFGLGHRFFRGKQAWYQVVGLTATGLQLASPYVEPSATASGYQCVTRYVALQPDDALITTVIAPRRFPWYTVEPAVLSTIAPDRLYATTGPRLWEEGPSDPDGTKTLELYPYSTQPELLAAVVYQRPPLLKPHDPIPSSIEPLMLREGALVDVMRWKMAQALDKGQNEIGATWRNEARAQEVRWENLYQGEIAHAAQGADDLQFILSLTGGPVNARPDIVTAYDEVWSRP